jgi:hypothetical protein
MAFGVDIAGNYAYVGFGFPDYGTGMCVVSVADPHDPQVVGYCGAPGIWWATPAVCGSHVFLANQEGGLRIIDISNPQNPHEVAYSSIAASEVSVRGNYAYALADSQLYVLDVTDPLNPQQVGSCLSAASEVALDGDYAYLSDGASGGCALRVIRISDPQSLQEVGHYWMWGDASGVAVGGGHVYVARYYEGLQVIDFYGAALEETSSAEVRAPKCGPTVVRGVLFLPERPSPSASLLDAAGRKVMDVRPGANEVGRVSPGVYFVRQASSVSRDASSVTKVVIQH